MSIALGGAVYYAHVAPLEPKHVLLTERPAGLLLTRRGAIVVIDGIRTVCGAHWKRVLTLGAAGEARPAADQKDDRC